MRTNREKHENFATTTMNHSEMIVPTGMLYYLCREWRFTECEQES